MTLSISIYLSVCLSIYLSIYLCIHLGAGDQQDVRPEGPGERLQTAEGRLLRQGQGDHGHRDGVGHIDTYLSFYLSINLYPITNIYLLSNNLSISYPNCFIIY